MLFQTLLIIVLVNLLYGHRGHSVLVEQKNRRSWPFFEHEYNNNIGGGNFQISGGPYRAPTGYQYNTYKCSDEIPRYNYDVSDKICKILVYSSCGRTNNFDTKSQCLQKCGLGSSLYSNVPESSYNYFNSYTPQLRSKANSYLKYNLRKQTPLLEDNSYGKSFNLHQD